MGKLGLKKTSTRINKKPAAKKEVEKIVDALHNDERKVFTLRLSAELHKTLKIKAATDETSINEYIVGLIRDDLAMG